MYYHAFDLGVDVIAWFEHPVKDIHVHSSIKNLRDVQTAIMIAPVMHEEYSSRYRSFAAFTGAVDEDPVELGRLLITGLSVGLGRRLRFPDDNFTKSLPADSFIKFRDSMVHDVTTL